MDLISTLIIDRVLSVGGLALTDGELAWRANQISACTLNGVQENQAVTDAVGVTIGQLMRAKSVNINVTSKTLDFGIMAAQWGTKREISSATNKIVGTVFDTHTLTAAEVTAGKYSLGHIPLDVDSTAGSGLKYIYKLDSRDNHSEKFTYGATASASAFTYTTGNNEITLPTGAFAAGEKVFAAYSYEANATDVAMSIISDAEKSQETVKGVVECLFRDPCNDNIKIYGFFIVPKCKPDGNFSASIASDGTHEFTLLGQTDYCGDGGVKTQIQVFVPDYAA